MLQLILGRAGSGKTEYAFSLIKKLIRDGEKNILLITPEQFSFVCERRLLSELGESKVNFVENGSFSRLSDEITKKYGGAALPVLSKGAKAVLFKKAIESVKDKLVLFNKNTDNIAFVNSMIRIYDEMKSCRVTCEDILSASGNSEKEILSLKLRDIAAIIDAYDCFISEKYLDAANELTRLYEKLLNLDYFKNRTVIIDSFTGFVAQEYKIIEVILKQAKNVYITFCTDSYNNSNKYDLFSYVNSNIAILKDVAYKVGVQIAEPVFLSNSRRFHNDELDFVEKYAYSGIKTTYNDEPKHLQIYCAKNIADECDNVSLEISKLLRKGIKASDIAVVCRDLDKYKKQLEFSFDKFNIPYFNDERQNISSQPLIMFVNFLLRIGIYSFRSDDIFSLLKTALTPLESTAISDLENYVFLWNIQGSKWKKEFGESTKGFVETITDSDKKKLDEINTTREYIIDRLEKFTLSARRKNPKEICSAVYNALISFSVDKGLKGLAVSLMQNGKSALAMEQERVWDLLMDILDKLALVGGEEKISLKEFYKLFNLMISCEDLGALPAGLDNVQLGSADRMRYNNPYAVFIVGANEGEFPQNVSSSGLLSESDRIALIHNNFKLYSYGETLNAQERFFAYNAISAATDLLYISYRGGKNEGIYSSAISGILDVFPKAEIKKYSAKPDLELIESKANAFELLASNYNEKDVFISSLKEYFKNEKEYSNRLEAVHHLSSNQPVRIEDKNLAKDLFGKDMYLSASKVEDYYNCAFRYFCKFGLGARPRTKAEMDPMQTGTVIHYVLEQTIKKVGSKGLVELSDSQINHYVNLYLQDFLHNKMGNSEEFTARFKYQFMRLSKMLSCVVLRLRDEFAQSDFEARAFELKIGNGEKNEPVKSRIIELQDGGTVQINGSIDRVDTYVENDKQYVRVVDYKSGTKSFQLSDILNGLNLQMFIYLFSLCNSDSELAGISSGVLYMHSARGIYNLERTADRDKIESRNKDSFKMLGVVLNDDENEIAEHMEKDLNGNFIPVKLTKSKGLTGSIVSLADLGRLSIKIDSLLKEMGLNLHNGNIDQNPVFGKNHDKTCEFCDYSDICKNRKEIFVRELAEKNRNEVLEQLKEEQADA